MNFNCGRCTEKKQILDCRDLTMGSHICFPGQISTLNIHGKQLAFYFHHGIVKNVTVPATNLPVSQSDVVLIHFWKTSSDDRFRIQETTIHLDLTTTVIYMVKYKHPTHDPDTIIRNAEYLVNTYTSNAYSLLSFNCEHLCHQVCASDPFSAQAESVLDFVKHILNSLNVRSDAVKLALNLLCTRSSNSVELLKPLVDVSWAELLTVISGLVIICAKAGAIGTHLSEFVDILTFWLDPVVLLCKYAFKFNELKNLYHMMKNKKVCPCMFRHEMVSILMMLALDLIPLIARGSRMRIKFAVGSALIRFAFENVLTARFAVQ